MSCRGVRNEDGSGTAELVLMAPLVVAVFLLVVGLGRMADARQDVNGAAAEAARAASLQRNTALSAAAARLAANATLRDRAVSCEHLTVSVDIGSYQPGGSVTATVTCVAALGDVALSGLPGSRTFQATAVVPIEQYRAGG